MKRSHALIMLASLAVMGSYASWRYFGRAGGPERARAAIAEGRAAGRTGPGVPATVIEAQLADFPIMLRGLGTVQPYNTVTVRSRVDGEIKKIFFREGQIISLNEPLAQIDPKPYQAALEQAQAKKAQDEASLQNARADLQRYLTLKMKEFATAQQVDTQTASVAQITAQLQADEAAIDNAQTQLAYTEIRAPLSGLIGFRLVDQGNIVNASSQNGIVSIAQVQPISVVFTLPEKEIGRVTKSMAAGVLPITAFTTDGSRKLADGVVSVVNNQVDVATGTIQIKATFENADLALWPGQSVSVQLRVAQLSDVLVLPQSAIQHGPQGLWAYVVDADNRVTARTVQIGESDSDNAVITQGVHAGERIVTAGQYRLQEGAIVDPAPASASAAATEGARL